MDFVPEYTPTKLNHAFETIEKNGWNNLDELWHKFWDATLYCLAPDLFKLIIYQKPEQEQRIRELALESSMKVVSLWGARFVEKFGMSHEMPDDLETYLHFAPTRFTYFN